ncbi:MAG: hypothetical protein JXJ20_03550 [Anaerolineae bacterium]|nr:hypothetical protein [Anaerolineae bacterium]
MDTLLFDSHLTTGGSGNGNKPNDPNDSDFADGADGGADEGAGGDSAGPPGPGEITGLPEDYDPRYIPTQRVMQMTAERELDDWIAFLLLHQDAPDIIVDQLENIASTIIAALNVPEPGEHLIKAVRLSLALKPEYWIAGDKAHIWSELFASLLPISINLHDGAYCSSAYRIWGIYRHLTHECPTKVLDVSEEYALDVKREDLALLARAERFDMQVTTLSPGEAEAAAKPILADARRLNWPLIQGRVYYSLARAYQQATLPRSAFNYAQQALAFFFQQDVPWLAAVAINAMLGSIQLLDDH